MRRGEERFTDAQVLAGLRAAAEVMGDPLRAGRYDDYQRDHDVLSSTRIIQRFGSWNAACQQAGLQTNRGNRAGSGRWSDAELLQHVATYLASPGNTGSYDGYGAWAKETDGAPSSQTVRNRFGGWKAAKEAAQALQ